MPKSYWANRIKEENEYKNMIEERIRKQNEPKPTKFNKKEFREFVIGTFMLITLSILIGPVHGSALAILAIAIALSSK